MNYIKKLGEMSEVNGKIIFTGLAYEIETGKIRCFKQSVSDFVNATRDVNLMNKYNIRLTVALQNFYNHVEQVEIGWQLLEYNPPEISFDRIDGAKLEKFKGDSKKAIMEGAFKIEGYMKISSLKELLEGPKGKGWLNVLWFDSMNDKEKEFWRQYMVFDYSVPECFILLKKENGVIEDNLYYYYNGNDLPIDMHMTVDEYLDIACKVKVFKGWQYALMKEPLDHGETLRQMKHYLPQIFPKLEFDFSDFQ